MVQKSRGIQQLSLVSGNPILYDTFYEHPKGGGSPDFWSINSMESGTRNRIQPSFFKNIFSTWGWMFFFWGTEIIKKTSLHEWLGGQTSPAWRGRILVYSKQNFPQKAKILMETNTRYQLKTCSIWSPKNPGFFFPFPMIFGTSMSCACDVANVFRQWFV